MMKKIIKEQDPIPKFYGITMMCLPGNELVCHPIPLNIIISTWKKVRLFLKRGFKSIVAEWKAP